MSSVEVSEQQGVRYLHLGSPLIQGAMRIARPFALELEYTREMLLPLLLHADEAWPSRVLQVGLGAASLTRFLHRHRPRARLTVLEIRPDVVAAARQFFKLPEPSEHLGIVTGDACETIVRLKGRFDLVLVDGFDGAGNAGMLETVPFYLNVRERLARGGFMACNLLSGRRGIVAGVGMLGQAFGEGLRVLPPCGAGNTVAIACAGPAVDLPLARMSARALALKATTGLDLRPTLDRLDGRAGGSGA